VGSPWVENGGPWVLDGISVDDGFANCPLFSSTCQGLNVKLNFVGIFESRGRRSRWQSWTAAGLRNAWNRAAVLIRPDHNAGAIRGEGHSAPKCFRMFRI